MLMLKKLIISNVQYNRVVLKFEDFIFQANRIAGFFFLIILSELTDQCIIAIYRQGSSALVVHLVNVFPLISRKFNPFFYSIFYRKTTMTTLFQKTFWSLEHDI
jgi:hypothetical protein